MKGLNIKYIKYHLKYLAQVMLTEKNIQLFLVPLPASPKGRHVYCHLVRDSKDNPRKQTCCIKHWLKCHKGLNPHNYLRTIIAVVGHWSMFGKIQYFKKSENVMKSWMPELKIYFTYMATQTKYGNRSIFLPTGNLLS